MLVTSAAALIESMPFILAGAALQRVPLRWSARVLPYLGCGCGSGPSARSLPAAAAAWLVFGPAVAAARLVAAMLVDRFRPGRSACEFERDPPLAQLAAVAPFAVAGSALALLAPAIGASHGAPSLAFGALAAFVSAPCAIGAIGFASAVRASAPQFAYAFLCIAGIADARVFLRKPHAHARHDSLAYAIAALACAFVAAKHGGGLVHPRLALCLWPCAAACAVLAYRYRGHAWPALRIAPAIMLVGTILAAPPPVYHVTETTLADAFPGERIDFTGMLTRTGTAATLVRYAITCCRADAAPIVIRLERRAPASLHGWVRARGMLVNGASGLALHASELTPVATPADPFVYR